jgi:hypothetical protein
MTRQNHSKGFLFKSGSILIVAVLIAIMITTAAAAQEQKAEITVTPLGGTYYSIKLVFPYEMSGKFAGVIYGKLFACDNIDSNTLYCTGPLPAGPKYALLNLYSYDSDEVVYQDIITIPPQSGGEPTPVPSQAPPEVEIPQ